MEGMDVADGSLSPLARYRTFLSSAGLRLTTQRMALLSLIFGTSLDDVHGDYHYHITAEQLFKRAAEESCSVSLATVYNTLNHLVAIGLMKVVHTPSGTVFDTHMEPHTHLYDVDTKCLMDSTALPIPDTSCVPAPDYRVLGVDVVVHVRQHLKPSS